MKALLQFIFPSLKAFVAVLGFMFTVVSASYVGIVSIAKTEAKGIEEKMLAVRAIDVEHFDKRFSKIDDKLDKIQALIKETR
jgi:hypothetical protein